MVAVPERGNQVAGTRRIGNDCPSSSPGSCKAAQLDCQDSQAADLRPLETGGDN